MTTRKAKELILGTFGEYWRENQMSIKEYPNFNLTEIRINFKDVIFQYDISQDSDKWTTVRKYRIEYHDDNSPYEADWQERSFQA